MKKNLIFKLFLVLFLLPTAKTFAQESIMNDIDYPFLNKLILSAQQNYPQIKIKQANVDIAKTTVKSAKLSWLDNLAASYVYNPQSTFNQVNPNIYLGYQIFITLNLGTIFKTPQNIKSAKANYNIALLEQQSFNTTTETQVKRLYFTYVQQVAVLRLRTKSAQDVESLLNQTKRQFEKGNETVENYTKATTALDNANQAKIEAEVASLIAKGALEEIVGQKLEEVK